MENVLQQVSLFYGTPVWYCFSGFICTFIVGIALALLLQQRPNIPQLILFVLAIFLSGWLAVISWAAVIFGLKAVYDGCRTRRQ